MEYDVVVAGAGPVGLMLACELRLQGIEVLVVERRTEPDLTVKAGSITVPTAEAFERRGMLPALAYVHEHALAQMAAFAGGPAAPAPSGNSAARPRGRPSGHFAGLWSLDASRIDGADPDFPIGPAASVVMVSQQAIEAILAKQADDLGVEVRRGVEVSGFTDNGHVVDVEIGDEHVRAKWLAGCDGGRSTVRRVAGFEFPGTDPTITGHQAIVDIVNPELLPNGWNRTAVGMLVHGPVAGRILTVEFDGPPADRDAPVTLEELQTSLRTVSGTEVSIRGVMSATRFTDNARQATTYRIGRVLLAGDAAHVHSPFGGQGLNLGIGDAVNLGWKLAATVRGTAPDGLLDTYTEERHPVGAWVLEWTRAQVALMRPDAHTGALRDIVADLMMTNDGNNYFIKKISGVGVRYDLGESDDLVGKRAPNFELDDGTRLADHNADGSAVLWDFEDGGALRTSAAGWTDRVNVITARCAGRGDIGAMVVRPDGVIAWVSRGAASNEGLTAALARWFGAPIA
jgi:2-polyprenyl-6-methoxyphenol hydroxylase-like FAD-dependent oxidoreductase